MCRDEALAAVERQRGKLVRWMVRHCGSYAEAQDMAAEVVALAAEAADLPGEPRALRSWLVGKAQTVARRERRRRRRRRQTLGSERALESLVGDTGLTFEDIVPDGARPIEDGICRRQISQRVLGVLDTWPAEERDLLLATAAGATYVETARTLGISKYQVRRHVILLRRKLLAGLDAETAAELTELIGRRAGP